MTVDQNSISSSFLDEKVYLLADIEHLRVAGDFEILPVCVEIADSGGHKEFRLIRKPNSITDETVSADRMLTRLLQIKNSLNIKRFKLWDYIEFLDLAVWETCACNEEISDEVWMETVYDRLFTSGPVFNPASFTEAQRANQRSLVWKVWCDNCTTVFGFLSVWKSSFLYFVLKRWVWKKRWLYRDDLSLARLKCRCLFLDFWAITFLFCLFHTWSYPLHFLWLETSEHFWNLFFQ